MDRRVACRTGLRWRAALRTCILFPDVLLPVIRADNDVKRNRLCARCLEHTQVSDRRLSPIALVQIQVKKGIPSQRGSSHAREFTDWSHRYGVC